MRTEQTFFHIDVNSAYLAWEALERLAEGETLDLRTIPAIVGGDEASRKGIVLSKSLPCKPYGINTGAAMITYLQQFSDRVQQYSIDEAFVDYTHKTDF